MTLLKYVMLVDLGLVIATGTDEAVGFDYAETPKARPWGDGAKVERIQVISSGAAHLELRVTFLMDSLDDGQGESRGTVTLHYSGAYYTEEEIEWA